MLMLIKLSSIKSHSVLVQNFSSCRKFVQAPSQPRGTNAISHCIAASGILLCICVLKYTVVFVAVNGASPFELSKIPSDDVDACLGDLFSVAWIELAEHHSLELVTVQREFERVRVRTSRNFTYEQVLPFALCRAPFATLHARPALQILLFSCQKCDKHLSFGTDWRFQDLCCILLISEQNGDRQ